MGINKQDSDKTVRPSTVLMFGRALEQRSEDEVRAALQAVLEGKSAGQSSLDDKLVYEFEGVRFSERQMRNDRFYKIRADGSPQVLRRHRNGGGWVPLEQSESDESMPYVADSVFVGPLAMVYDNAHVYGFAEVHNNAHVRGNAHVYGFAQIHGNAHVSGNAHVYGNAYVYDNADVSGSAMVFGYVHVYGGSTVFGKDSLSKGSHGSYHTAITL